MSRLAIITARGGSKRIPRKNIKEFNGEPIIAYSIRAALQSGLFDTVMVSTDDEEIAEISKRYGAEIPFYRSAYTAGDHATTNDVLLEVLEEYERRGQSFDVAACLYPTAPFVTAEKLRDGVRQLEASDADTLIPVVAFSYPPQRAMVVENDRLVFKYPEYLDSRSQDLQPHYHDAGQFYIFRTEAFRRNRRLMVGNILPMIVSEMEVQDIDNETDWKLAEIKYGMMQSSFEKQSYLKIQLAAKQTIKYVKSKIKPGMNLRDVRRLCEEKLLELGADSFWYWGIGAFVFAGDDTAVSVSGKQYITADRTVGGSDIITIDLSPQRGDIWGDYARTIIIENGKVVDDIDNIENKEWKNGLRMEEKLHAELLAFVTRETTFEKLHEHMNEFIESNGFVNLDFMGNLGHSIVKEKGDRIYIEKGNTKKLSEVKYFTFEPHIAYPNSKYGFKKENIYYFNDGKLAEL